MSSFTPDQLAVVQIAIKVSSSLSFIGTLAIILHMVMNSSARKSNINRLIFYMSICDCIASQFQFVGNYGFNSGDQTLCTIQGFFIQWMTFGAILWSAAISINILILFSKQRSADSLKAYEKWYALVAYGMTFVIAFALIFIESEEPSLKGKGMYDSATLWCWVKGGSTGNWARFGVFFFPLWGVFLFNVCIYSYVGRIVYKTSRDLENLKIRRQSPWEIYVRKTVLYMIAFIINWLPATVNRIQGLIPGSQPVFMLFVLHAIFTPLQGFLNALVYFFSVKMSNSRFMRGKNVEDDVDIQPKSQSFGSSSPASSINTKYEVEYVGEFINDQKNNDVKQMRFSTINYAMKDYVVDPGLFNDDYKPAKGPAPPKPPSPRRDSLYFATSRESLMVLPEVAHVHM